MSESIYEISNLVHRYGDHIALEIPELRIDRGSIVGLVGPNGSGKSTLLKILAFLESPSEGRVHFEGKKAHMDNGFVRRDVTLLLQDPYLLKRPVFDNVAYGLKVRGKDRKLRDRIYESLMMVGLEPELFAHRAWYELSGGEAQRVALASRLILSPKVLLLDEPIASVDATSALLIKEASLKAKEEWGTTLVIATHDTQWLHKVSDRVLNLFHGRIVGFGPENLLAGPWIRVGHRLYKKALSDGQHIFASAPPNHNSVAVLDPADIQVTSNPPAAVLNHNLLSGTLTQMIFEDLREEVIINISVGNVVLASRIKQNQAKDLSLHPGRPIWLSFKPEALRWL